MTNEDQEFLDALQNKNYILIRLTLHGRPNIMGPYGLPVLERSEWMTQDDALSDERYRNNLTWYPFSRQTARFNNLL